MGTSRQHPREDTAEPSTQVPAGGRARASGRAARFSAFGAFLLASVLAFFWTGCEVKVTEKNYKSLSFWFDGVRDPNAPDESLVFRGGGKGGTTRPVRTAIVSQHKPYVEKKCAECHKMAGEKPEFALAVTACVKCHEKVLNQYAVMHGPVGAGACQWCHEPHQSSLPVLLRADSAQLCTQCHDRRVLSPETAEHQSETKGCLDCHVGHGGTDRRLLRATGTPLWPATHPATSPATQPVSRPAGAAEKGGL